MKTHFFFHVPFEGAGNIKTWAESHGYPVTETSFWAGERVPALEAVDFLVVMGGPMNIYEEKEHPWLKEEKIFIEKAIRAGKKVLGVCLGAQLIADVLGGKVYKNSQKEIGWFPVELTPEAKKMTLVSEWNSPMPVFQWHGDTFHLPRGAVLLARSGACENQAFVYENQVVGLQFHLESTPESVQSLVENCREELKEGLFIQSEKEILSNQIYYFQIHTAMNSLLEQLVREKSPRVSSSAVS